MEIRFEAGEAEAVAELLLAMAACDGGLGPDERAFLEQFVERHGVKMPGLSDTGFDDDAAMAATALDPAAAATAEVARVVVDPDKRREVVRLCLQLALADRDYALEETAMVKRIAGALGVSDIELVMLTMDAREARR
jgi:uncharacterized tellurite resistance protein B-like protein